MDTMQSGLADFIERHAGAIVEEAVAFARGMQAGEQLRDEELRDHLPEIVGTIVADLRMPQTQAEEIAKSEGRNDPRPDAPRSAAAIHAVHRAHSGFSITSLLAEYRAMRAAVLRAWAVSEDNARPAPAEITRFNEAIDQAIAQSVEHYAKEVERWRHIFLGVLAHDLRGPLTAILINADTLVARAGSPEVARIAERVRSSSENMAGLLEKLLAYNRARMGVGLAIERADVDLARACRDEVDELRASLPGACIVLDAPASLEAHVDARGIREVLSNLVTNAYKYGTRGGDIRIRLAGADDCTELTVTNSGTTIPPELLATMFDPLRRGGVAARELERASLGLGLFIVEQVVRAHGGRVTVDSADGTTQFRVVLPLQPPAQGGRDLRRTDPAAPSCARGPDRC